MRVGIFGIGLGNPVLCTLRMSRRFMPSLKRRRLDLLAGHFGLSLEGRHRGLGVSGLCHRMARERVPSFSRAPRRDARDRRRNSGALPPVGVADVVERDADGVLHAVPVFGASNLIFTLVRADALVAVPLDRSGLAAGERVRVIVP